MSRFMQVPQETPKTTKEKPRELPKVGSYSSENLGEAKKIPTKEGYK